MAATAKDAAKPPILKKPAGLIHSEGLLTAPQRKMFNALLYHAYPHLLREETGTYTMEMTRLRELTGIGTRNAQWVRENLEALQSLRIDWDLLGELNRDTRKRSNCRVGRSVPIPDVGVDGDGRIHFTLSPWTAAALQDRKLYAKLNLLLQANIRSRAGLITLEVAVHYGDWGYSRKLPVDFWRRLYGCEGKYKAFRDFRRQVLEPGIREVSEKTDYHIEIDYQRSEGARVDCLQLRIQNASPSPEHQAVVNRMIERAGIKPDLARTLTEQHGWQRVIEVLDALDLALSGDSSRIKNPAGWVTNALNRGWDLGDRPARSPRRPEHAPCDQRIKASEEKQADRTMPFADWRDEVLRFWRALPTEAAAALEQSFRDTADRRIARLLDKQGLESSPVLAEFAYFIYRAHRADLPAPPPLQ